jgi:hypothetical protein
MRKRKGRKEKGKEAGGLMQGEVSTEATLDMEILGERERERDRVRDRETEREREVEKMKLKPNCVTDSVSADRRNRIKRPLTFCYLGLSDKEQCKSLPTHLWLSVAVG